MPPPGPNGQVDPAAVPEFVAVASRDGDGIAGYSRRADVLEPPIEETEVFGEDLRTIVGHLVPGKGFIPVGVDPDSVAAIPAREAPAAEAVAPGDKVVLYIRNGARDPVYPAVTTGGKVRDSGIFDGRSMGAACYRMAEGDRLVLLDRPAQEPGVAISREILTRDVELPAPSLWLDVGDDGTVRQGVGFPAWFGSPVGC